jgi:hypothetical protein
MWEVCIRTAEKNPNDMTSHPYGNGAEKIRKSALGSE